MLYGGKWVIDSRAGHKMAVIWLFGLRQLLVKFKTHSPTFFCLLYFVMVVNGL
jgi:hypothetical protein